MLQTHLIVVFSIRDFWTYLASAENLQFSQLRLRFSFARLHSLNFPRSGKRKLTKWRNPSLKWANWSRHHKLLVNLCQYQEISCSSRSTSTIFDGTDSVSRRRKSGTHRACRPLPPLFPLHLCRPPPTRPKTTTHGRFASFCLPSAVQPSDVGTQVACDWCPKHAQSLHIANR